MKRTLIGAIRLSRHDGVSQLRAADATSNPTASNSDGESRCQRQAIDFSPGSKTGWEMISSSPSRAFCINNCDVEPFQP
jgi:hypothetical protein